MHVCDNENVVRRLPCVQKEALNMNMCLRMQERRFWWCEVFYITGASEVCSCPDCTNRFFVSTPFSSVAKLFFQSASPSRRLLRVSVSCFICETADTDPPLLRYPTPPVWAVNAHPNSAFPKHEKNLGVVTSADDVVITTVTTRIWSAKSHSSPTPTVNRENVRRFTVTRSSKLHACQAGNQILDTRTLGSSRILLRALRWLIQKLNSKSMFWRIPFEFAVTFV